MAETRRMSLTELAKRHFYEPATDESANPIIRELQLTPGEIAYNARRWRSTGPSFIGLCYFPGAPLPRTTDRAAALGARMIEKGLGWEHHDVEYAPFPRGYKEWGIEIIKNHTFHLMGEADKADFIYGAIYCSLGDYSVSPPLLRSLLEKWDPYTNTFLFPCGERTITLLDLHRMAGLPVDGEYYEEYVPPNHELEPSLLLYPNFLSDLLATWDLLEVGGEVKYQAWCDHFFNRLESPISFSSVRDEHMFVAAFLALWLCCFAIVGGGPHIRRGVLVMAAWMSLGRRFSLAPPALCSLYYSLRLISQHPIGPSYSKRIWPIHYIIGWMGLYLKRSFGNKEKTLQLPPYKHKYSSEKPSMLNTMWRISEPFNPELAHDYFHKRTNLAWHPYEFTPLKGVRQLERAFIISIRRGMLPWRRVGSKADLCIAEPYHPDRVARQFRFDQVVPFSPLPNLYTMDDIGIAYAYWEHLLRLERKEEYVIPDDSRIGNSSVPWVDWWSTFVQPFSSVWSKLRSGNACGQIPYKERKEMYGRQGDWQAGRVRARRVSQRDLQVVKEISTEHQEQRIADIAAKAKKRKAVLMRILHVYLDQTAYPAQPAMQQMGSAHLVDAAGSSSNPLLLDNISAREHLMENQVQMPTESSGKRSSSHLISLGGEHENPVKKKLNFGDEVVIYDSASLPIIPTGDEVNNEALDQLFQSVPSPASMGLSDVDIDDFFIAGPGNCPQPLPLVSNDAPLVDLARSKGEYLQPPSNMTHAVISVVESSDPVSSYLNDFEQQPDNPSNSKAAPVFEETPSMDAFIQQVLMEAADQMLVKALEGLDINTLRDPARRISLEHVAENLPLRLPSILRAKEMLTQLIAFSRQLQSAHDDFASSTGQKDQRIVEARHELDSHVAATKLSAQEERVIAEKCLEKRKLVTSLTTQLNEATDALKELELEEERIHKVRSNQEVEAKKLNDILLDATKGLDQATLDFQAKTTDLEQGVEKLFENLKNWRSGPN